VIAKQFLERGCRNECLAAALCCGFLGILEEQLAEFKGEEYDEDGWPGTPKTLPLNED